MKIGGVIGGGNNQQRFEVKKVLSDKNVFPSLSAAPINDEAKKDNENLSSMGGVYNMVNLHVYHYAGYSQRSFELYNPVKYIDPDGKFHFAKHNLDAAPWLGIFSNNPLDDLFNTEISHEHGFF